MQDHRTGRSIRHWQTLTDDQLLNVQLTTDNPMGVENLVFEIPSGDEETYVEQSYDFRNTDHEEFLCVHGNHGHKAGFVMRKGNSRYLVGHMCAKTLYGENFEAYKTDHASAINRQTAHRRRRELQDELNPFLEWVKSIEKSGVFHKYIRVRQMLINRLPWIFDYARTASHFGYVPKDGTFPLAFFEEHHNPERDFKAALAETESITNGLEKRETFDDKTVHQIKQTLLLSVRRIETAIKSLSNVERLFQPTILQGLCDFANTEDNRRRKYSFGLMSLSCKQGRETQSVQVPPDFTIPRLADLERFRMSINHI